MRRDMTVWCVECGNAALRDLPCRACWRGEAKGELVRRLARAAAKPTLEDRQAAGLALTLLSRIDDPAAQPALRELASHSHGRIRAAAILSLGWSGDADDVAFVAATLSDDDVLVRNNARSALAALGGPLAADALGAGIEALKPDERAEAQAALAWLEDDRDLPGTRELALAQFDSEIRQGYGHERGQWLAVPALVRLGTDADRSALIELAIGLLTSRVRVDPNQPGRYRDLSRADAAFEHLMWHLRAAGHHQDEATAIARLMDDEHALEINAVRRRRHPNAVPCEPTPGRTAPKLAMHRHLGERTGPGSTPPPKFGGQPDWVDKPTWPLSPSGNPMVFLGQLPLLGRSDCTAYIFFSPEVDETWESLSSGNAVVVQPGATPHLPTVHLTCGPMLFEPIYEPHRYRQVGKNRPYERFVSLKPDRDPTEWLWPDLPPAGGPLPRTATGTRSAEHPPGCRTIKLPPVTAGRSHFSSPRHGPGTNLATAPSATGSSRPMDRAHFSGSAAHGIASWPRVESAGLASLRRDDSPPPGCRSTMRHWHRMASSKRRRNKKLHQRRRKRGGTTRRNRANETAVEQGPLDSSPSELDQVGAYISEAELERPETSLSELRERWLGVFRSSRRCCMWRFCSVASVHDGMIHRDTAGSPDSCSGPGRSFLPRTTRSSQANPIE